MENQNSTKQYGRTYRVIVKNINKKIVVCHLFECQENALVCYAEFLQRYSHYYRIIIEATQK